MPKGVKSIETRHYEERDALFDGLGRLSRRAFFRVAGISAGIAAAKGLVTPRSSTQHELDLGRIGGPEAVDRVRLGRHERIDPGHADLGPFAARVDARQSVEADLASANAAGRQLDVELDAEKLERIGRLDAGPFTEVGDQADIR